MPATVEDARLKQLLKEALTEVLEERKDLLGAAVAEALEDLALVRAIRAGARSAAVTRSEIFDILGET